MSSQITLTLPDTLMHRAQGMAGRLGCPVDEVLVRFLESSLSPLGAQFDDQPIGEWTDEAVLAAADLQMSEDEDNRFSDLLFKQQARTLVVSEQSELSGLMLAYQQGLVHKARALAEAVHRRLREAPKP